MSNFFQILRTEQTIGMAFLSDPHIFYPWCKKALKPHFTHQPLKYIALRLKPLTWRIHLHYPFWKSHPRYIKSSWKIDAGKSFQMGREPSNDPVKGKLEKAGSGDRGQQGACQHLGRPGEFLHMCMEGWTRKPAVLLGDRDWLSIQGMALDFWK